MSFKTIADRTIENILRDLGTGTAKLRVPVNAESNLFGDGFEFNIANQTINRFSSKERKIISMQPNATVLVKKKIFSSLRDLHDLQWLDKTEKLLMRATKALFAYKCSQYRSYEMLTKINKEYAEYKTVNLALFVDFLNSTRFVTIDKTKATDNILQVLAKAVSNTLEECKYEEYKKDVLKVLERHVFSLDEQYTTWIVDPQNLENYGTGPGTGVMEICSFSNFDCSSTIESSPQTASFSVPDPQRLSVISSDDIEMAIEEALFGSLNLLSCLANGSLKEVHIIRTKKVHKFLQQ
jgi:hypothetical protein